jgi:hypothetical protein
MAIQQATPGHPILGCAAEVAAALEGVADIDPTFMTTRDKATALIELARLTSRLRGLALRILAASDDVALEHGARSADTWLAHETRADIGPSLAAGRLAEALEGRWGVLREALSEGRVTEAQAHVIARALDDLPAGLDPEVLAKAEAHLIAEAAHFEPRRLRVLGRKVLEVVAPDLAETHEQHLLESEEARALRTTSLTIRRRGDGSTDIHIRLADAAAGRLLTYLEAYAAPRRGRLAGDSELADPDNGQRVSHATRLGRAFCSALEAIPTARLPKHGGSATSVVVTIDHETLRSQLGSAGLGSGERISATEAVRLACNASILPLVLDGDGQPLHLGRARRLFSSGQRMAMAVRDRSCRADGCSIPADWCEAHHRKPWMLGGRTDVTDGVLLCSWHHHRAHDSSYRVDTMPNGDVRFSRRT